MMKLLSRAVFGADPKPPPKRPSLTGLDELRHTAGDLLSCPLEHRRDWTVEDWDALLAAIPEQGPFDTGSLPGPFMTFWQYAEAAGRRAYQEGQSVVPRHYAFQQEGVLRSFQQGFLDAMAKDVHALLKRSKPA